MIRANELRIGNYVNMHGVAKIIDAIHSNNYVEFDNNDTTHHFTKIEPIPLTEEILTKCGFDKKGLTYNNKTLKLWHSEYNKCFVVRLYNIGSELSFEIRINYLHQLQNLVYALTGEELQITL